jgi:quercetin dioxygenase-like cupin family protein
MDTMTTLSQVLNHLKETGYTEDFNLDNNCLICSGNSLKIHPEDFVVDKHYRFEGMSDPADEAVVYAISSTSNNIKGTVVNGYGIYSDPETDNMIRIIEAKSRLAGPPLTSETITPLIHPNQGNAVTTETEEPSAQVKFNEATPLRPEGDRILDAPMTHMDLDSFIKQIKHEQAWITGDRNSITIFKTDVMRIVLIALHKDAEMKQHTAAGVISVQVLEGHISFRTVLDTAELHTGKMIALHAKIPHSVYAHEESVFLLTLAKTP